jgi:hypothetical protein
MIEYAMEQEELAPPRAARVLMYKNEPLAVALHDGFGGAPLDYVFHRSLVVATPKLAEIGWSMEHSGDFTFVYARNRQSPVATALFGEWTIARAFYQNHDLWVE